MKTMLNKTAGAPHRPMPRRASRRAQRLYRGMAAAAALLGLSLAEPSHAMDTEYAQRFLAQYQKIKDPAHGYFSPQGVPYHSVETLLVEAPDYGHETTSEAYSFWLWLEAHYGRATGDWSPLANAWANMESYIIPAAQDQPTNSFYNASRPATYAGEFPLPQGYPAPITSSVPVGQDPLAGELATAYGTRNIYGMHWLLDVDNWYGFGRCGDGTTSPAYINTFQRGPQESVWETVPHPSCETFEWGRTGNTQGFLSLFIGDSNYARQWRYTNAPDADARAVQAMYWASIWAREQGRSAALASLLPKAAKMGDYLRYAMFDKYFKRVGNCVGAQACPGGTGAANAGGFRDNQHYLMSWYYAWGGATDTSAGWAWRVGSSHNHFGYQNPLAAWALANVPDLRPLSSSGASDWAKSLTRQLEFYRWLQSSEGAIAGGATNSWSGNHETPPAGTTTFYGMFYDEKPVYHDPASNTWFGFQAWSMQRVAEYYYVTGDARAQILLDKWVAWASANTRLNAGGTYAVPNTLEWSGQPDTWNPAAPGANAGLHVRVVDTTTDVGTTAAFARTLIYYAARSGDGNAKTLAKELLDRMWSLYQTTRGVAVAEKRADYLRFDERFDASTGSGVYIPPGWTGTNAQGAILDSSTTFLSQRPRYRDDPQWPKLAAHLGGGPAPDWIYHRFWAQADIAMAMSDYSALLADATSPAIVVRPTSVDVPEGGSTSFAVTLSRAPAANVTVIIAKIAAGDVDLDAASASLVFTPSNYNVARTVQITAAEDADRLNGSASFELTAAGHTAARVVASETDNDDTEPVRLVVTGSPLSVPEGATRNFQVRLAAAPAGTVTVQTSRSGGDADLGVTAGATLSFTAANWSANQNVTIAAAQDTDTANGSATFQVAAAGADSVAVTASEQDDDNVSRDCSVTFDTSNDWGVGQVPRIILRNTGVTPIVGWSVSWTTSNDFQLVNHWSSSIAKTGRDVIATPAAWNGTIEANTGIEFGMQLSYSGAKPMPTNLIWRGRDCEIVVR